MRFRRAGIMAGMAALAGLAASCGPTGSRPGGFARPAAVRLVAYESCSQMLDQVRSEALAEVGPTGLPYSGMSSHGMVAFGGTERMAVSAPAAAGAEAAPTAGTAAGTDSSGSTSYSTTNNQEPGVDEPDLAKTNGTLLVTLRRQTSALQVADVASSPPRLRGALSLGDVLSPTGLFLVGTNAVVLGDGPSSVTPQPEAPVPGSSGASSGGASAPGSSGGGLTMPMAQQVPTTVVAVVSLAAPDHPVVTRSFTLQGSEVDARLISGEIEVVVVSGPRLPFVAPADSSSESSAAALAANSALIRSSAPADWLPSVTSSPSGTTHTTACTAAMHPDVASGLGTVSVVPIDPTSSQPGPALTVVGDATTVYASSAALYVATTSWPQLQAEGIVPMGGGMAASSGGPIGGPVVGSGTAVGGGTGAAGPAQTVLPEQQATTDIHGFDLSNPASPTYLGSAEVQGTLIGQYALSEYQGYLRVATTVGTATPPPSEGTAPAVASDNRVTVLQPEGGALQTVGTLSGLGTGEKIYAVRFLGPLGYVVTFRQTDPLYVLDLSDPQHPQSSGQLELSGYSSFLEPLPNGRLLGIGQDVNDQLRTQGLQLSLFDVSDPAHPSLVSKDVLDGAWSSAQDDPHALLWWAPAHLAVLPVTQQPVPVPMPGGAAAVPPSATSFFDGAIAFRVTDSNLSEAGRLTQPPAAAPSPPVGPYGAEPMPVVVGAASEIERSLVVGSMLYTVSETGIMASDLTSFQQVAWLAYP